MNDPMIQALRGPILVLGGGGFVGAKATGSFEFTQSSQFVFTRTAKGKEWGFFGVLIFHEPLEGGEDGMGRSTGCSAASRCERADRMDTSRLHRGSDGAIM
jgi:hypothetical protein